MRARANDDVRGGASRPGGGGLGGPGTDARVLLTCKLPTHRPAPAQFVDHGARFEKNSLVEKILGNEMVVNSSHHQAVKDPGSLKITGWAEDNTIEVLENPDHKFVIGVQWHPEMHHDKRLFAALVKAALHTPQ